MTNYVSNITHNGVEYIIKDNNATNRITNIEEQLTELQADSGGGHQMFDIITKDHILSYEETKGLAQLGTYVYKESIAGTRYGYPDFYAKCVEEYTAGTTANAYMSSNINVVGSLSNDNGVISGFSSSNYATLPSAFSPSSSTWEMVYKVTTGNDVTTAQWICGDLVDRKKPCLGISNEGFVTFLSSNGSTWDIAEGVTGGTVSANTTYYIKFWWNGATYYIKYSTDNETFTDAITITNSTPINNNNEMSTIGFSTPVPFLGSIDLSGCYINIDATRWWTGTNTCREAINKHRFYDIANKAAFDNMYAITGEAWYYGIDTTNERIFLPRSTRFKNGSTSDVGEYQSAGLPNITGGMSASHTQPWSNSGTTATGAFNKTTTTTPDTAQSSVSGYAGAGFIFDASRSNSIYGASNTVEYSSTKLIPYMVVGNTESTSSEIDVVNITTSENDTIPLGYSIYSGDVLSPKLGWLKSNGQWNSGAIYATFYNEAANSIGNDFGAGKIVENIDTYTDYDLVINQTEQTFRLPLRNGQETYISDEKIQLTITGTTYTDFVAPANGWVFGSSSNKNNHLFIVNNTKDTYANLYNKTDGNGTESNYLQLEKGDSYSLQYNSTTNVSGCFVYAKGIGDLYYKVANAVQNLELLNVGEILNSLQRVDNTVHIVDTYENGASGYNVYSNGFCEQWGYSAYTNVTVSLLKTYKNTDYNILFGKGYSNDTNTRMANVNYNSIATNSFYVSGTYNNTSGTDCYFWWRTCGYLADGQY